MTTKPHSIADLALMWERDQITAEQLMGQMLAHINLLQQQILQLARPATAASASPATPQRPVNTSPVAK